MAPRAYWKGYLKLSLVSCPIALYPASSGSERVSFNRINSKTGNRLKQQMVDAESGEPVDKEDIKRGYEYTKGQYIVVEDEEIDHHRPIAPGEAVVVRRARHAALHQQSGERDRSGPVVIA